MVDYLTTNWTEKIKTNPVANLILNNNFVKYKIGSLNEITGIRGTANNLKMPSKRQRFLRTSDNAYKNTSNKKTIRARILDDFGDVINPVDPNAAPGDDDDDEEENNNDNVVAEHDAMVIDADPEVEVDFVPGFYTFGQEEYEDTEPDPNADMWANTYVKDYINIHHSKLRPCYVSALSSRPLEIKPPSVFFSDV